MALYDVSTLGAVADGITDDLSVVQAALDQAGADGGGTVFLPAGTYFLSNVLLVPSNVTLMGSGAGTVLVNPAGAMPGRDVNGATYYGTVNMIGVTGATVRDLTIDHAANGSHANGVVLGSDGLGTRTTHSLVEGVHIEGADNHSYLIWNYRGDDNVIRNNTLNGNIAANTVSEQEGIEIYGGHNVTVENNTLVNIGSNALYAWEDTIPGSGTDLSGITFTGNTVTGARVGVNISAITSASAITVTNNTLSALSGEGDGKGVLISTGPAGELSGVLVEGNSIWDVAGPGVWLYGQGSTQWQDVTVRANTIAVTAATFIAVYVTAPNVAVENNTLNGASYSAIYVSGGSGSTITGNTVTAPGALPLWVETENSSGVTLQDNELARIGSITPTATLTLGLPSLDPDHLTTSLTVVFGDRVPGLEWDNLTLPEGLTVSPLASLNGGTTWTGTLTAPLGMSLPAAVISLDLAGAWVDTEGDPVTVSASATIAIATVPGVALNGGSGAETLQGGDGSDTITGNGGSDILIGGAGDDTLEGGEDNDKLYGGAGTDILDGGLGNDAFYIDDAGDTVIEAEGGGNDQAQITKSWVMTAGAHVEYAHINVAAGLSLTGNALANWLDGNAGNDTLDGSAGDDYLHGFTGDDTLYGGLGNDTLDGGAGNDWTAGGAGDDTYCVGSAQDTVWEALNEGFDTVFVTTASYALLAGQDIEVLAAKTGATGATLTGNALANTLRGDWGNDTLIGGGGNDTLEGGIGHDRLYGQSGADTLKGGSGNDAYYVTDTSDQIIENIGQGNDEVQASANWTATAGQEIEYIHINTSSGLSITGNEFANWLDGNTGADTLSGGGGNDYLSGLSGADLLSGGTGDDTFLISDTAMQVFELLGEGYDTAVVSAASWVATAGAHLEIIRPATSGLTVTGNELANLMTGTAGIDILRGGGGNDKIYGGGGADQLSGGTGNDAFYIVSGSTQIFENQGEGHDEVQLGVSWIMTAGQEIEYAHINVGISMSLTGNELDNWLDGNIGNDTLNGGGGADYLTGFFGADVLNGGTGNDIVCGGLDADTFAFSNAWGADWILDFENDADTLDLTAISDITSLGQLTISTLGDGSLLLTCSGHSGSIQISGNVTAATILDDIIV